MALRRGFVNFNRLNGSTHARYMVSLSNSVENKSQSIDAENVQLLSNMSKTWWDPNGEAKPLHAMNNVRVPFIRDGLISSGLVNPKLQGTSQVLKNQNILEVGCGGGILTEPLAKLNASVTGLEPSTELIEIARAHAKNRPDIASRISYVNKTIEEFTSSASNLAAFDAVIISEVVEHVNQPAEFLQNCLKTLKPGGSVFITTFNKTCLSWLGAILMAEQILRLVPENTHQWDKFLSPIEIQRILEENDCSVVLVNGLLYQPWCNRWRVISSDDVTYALHAIKH